MPTAIHIVPQGNRESLCGRQNRPSLRAELTFRDATRVSRREGDVVCPDCAARVEYIVVNPDEYLPDKGYDRLFSFESGPPLAAHVEPRLTTVLLIWANSDQETAHGIGMGDLAFNFLTDELPTHHTFDSVHDLVDAFDLDELADDVFDEEGEVVTECLPSEIESIDELEAFKLSHSSDGHIDWAIAGRDLADAEVKEAGVYRAAAMASNLTPLGDCAIFTL